MTRSFPLGLVFLAAFAATVHAQGAAPQAAPPADGKVLYDCHEPPPPQIVDGATATRQQVVDAHNRVTQYMADSDAFQSCVTTYMASLKARAFLNNAPEDQAALDDAVAKGKANQAAKQKAADDINAAIAAYKKAHP